MYSTKRIFFEEKEVKLIKANVAFARTGGRYPDIHITSWACQTGNAARESSVNENGTVTHQPTIDENMANSLAQTIADFLKVKVYASARKTDYEKTWDTGISGLWDDLTGTRKLIDEAIWENEGADNPVQSGTSNSGSVKMPQGMFSFNPGQRKNYQIIPLDY